MVQRNELTPFHVARFFSGHGPTDFGKWSKEDFGGSWYPIHYAMRLKPYVLGQKPGIDHYWESFRGLCYNKNSWFIDFHDKGYQFGVLRDFLSFIWIISAIEFEGLKQDSSWQKWIDSETTWSKNMEPSEKIWRDYATVVSTIVSENTKYVWRERYLKTALDTKFSASLPEALGPVQRALVLLDGGSYLRPKLV